MQVRFLPGAPGRCCRVLSPEPAKPQGMGIGIALASALVILVGPLILGLAGWANGRRAASDLPLHGPWRPAIVSALLYTLAFSLTFLIQELFLVLPKALTPCLRPTLLHNNHSWEGEHPLAALFRRRSSMDRTGTS
jgi:hypothetical protein